MNAFLTKLFKGSRSHLQISSNITKLCKDEIYDDVYEILYIVVVSCKIFK